MMHCEMGNIGGLAHWQLEEFKSLVDAVPLIITSLMCPKNTLVEINMGILANSNLVCQYFPLCGSHFRTMGPRNVEVSIV